MTTLNIQLPKTKYTFLSDDNEFQSIITETIMDYIEKKEDIKTRENLFLNKKFHGLNSKLEEKLGKL